MHVLIACKSLQTGTEKSCRAICMLRSGFAQHCSKTDNT